MVPRRLLNVRKSVWAQGLLREHAYSREYCREVNENTEVVCAMACRQHFHIIPILLFLFLPDVCVAQGGSNAEEIYGRLRSTYAVEKFRVLAAEFTYEHAWPRDVAQTVVHNVSYFQEGDKRRVTRRVVQPDNSYTFESSWNGEQAVRFNRNMNPSSTGSVTAHIDEFEGSNDEWQVFLTIIQAFDPNSPRSHCNEYKYDNRNGILTVSDSGSGYKERIHFSDPESLEYEKIEFLDPADRVLQTYSVEEWGNFNGLLAPKRSQIQPGDGSPGIRFELITCKTGLTHESAFYVVDLPYSEGVMVFDHRIKDYFMPTDVEEDLWKQKNYLAAANAAFPVKFANKAVGEAYRDAIKISDFSSEDPPPGVSFTADGGIVLKSEVPGAANIIFTEPPPHVIYKYWTRKVLGLCIILISTVALIVLIYHRIAKSHAPD